MIKEPLIKTLPEDNSITPVNNNYIKLSYEEEYSEDKKLQDMLIFTETINEYKLDDNLKFKTLYNLNFCLEKIDYLENLQKLFNLKNNTKRLTDISKYLDEITIEGKLHTTQDDFASKVSLLLDLLYSTSMILRDFYELHFKEIDTYQ